MLKLIKYEFLKRRKMLTGYLIAIIGIELLAIINLFLFNGNLAFTTALLTIALVGSVSIYTVVSYIGDYYGSLTKPFGLMQFSIPKSGYKILSAKSLYCLVEYIILTVIAIALAFLTNKFGVIAGFGNFYEDVVLSTIRMTLGAGLVAQYTVSLFILTVIIQFLFSISTGILAITISYTLLSRNKSNWVIAIAFYILLENVLKLIMLGISFLLFSDILNGDMTQTTEMLSCFVTFYIIYILAEYYVSSRLITRKLDL